MDIFLLRHGASTANEARLVCGASDYPLSESGREQARLVCRHLDSIPFTRIYSSPLSRAKQTIAPMITDLDVTIARELVELDTGEASHLCVDELWTRDRRYRYQGLNPDLRYPAGESLNDMLKRVAGWYRSASLSWARDEIVLVAGHEGTVCGILHHLLALDIVHYPTFTIGNCDFVHITINQDDQVRYRFVPLASITGAA